MGQRGPAPIPTAIKVFEGTYREDRHGGGVRVPDGAPLKPNWLGEIASLVWDERIEQMMATPGLLSPVDGPALALYCDAWQQLHDAKAIIAERGMVAFAESGAEYQHPAVGIANKARTEIIKLGSMFGMNPPSRVGMIVSGPTADDELAELIL